MKKGHRGGASYCGGRARKTGGDEKANDAAQISKREGLAKMTLEQPGRQNSLASIPRAIEYRGDKSSVAHEAGSNGADYNPNDERWTGTRPKCDQNPCGES